MSWTALWLNKGSFFTAFLLALVAWDLLLRGFHHKPPRPWWQTKGADIQRGRLAIDKYGCAGCHVIPGVRSARGRVGPKLEDFRDQVYIGGILTNTPENLARWIEDPRQFNPRSAMPDLGVSQEEARDIAAYLYKTQ